MDVDFDIEYGEGVGEILQLENDKIKWVEWQETHDGDFLEIFGEHATVVLTEEEVKRVVEMVGKKEGG